MRNDCLAPAPASGGTRCLSNTAVTVDLDTDAPAPASMAMDTKYVKSYSITGTGRKSAVHGTTNTGHEIYTDVPKKMGGGDTAPQPVETLLGALMGCTQATAVFVGRQMTPRLLIGKVEYALPAPRDERGALQRPIEARPAVPARLQVVSGVIRVFARGGGGITRKQLDTLAVQTEARCPVANMMAASGCKFDVEWVDGLDLDGEAQV